MANYPASLDAISNPTGATNQNDAGFLHSVQHGTANDILEQLEARVGIAEATPQNTPLANTVLQSTANGRSKWAAIVASMVAAQTITGGVAGAASNIAFGTISGGAGGANSNIAALSIATGDLQANAVSQVGVGIGSASSTIQTTFVDLAGCSVTLTTTGGDLIAILLGTFSNDTTGQVTYQALRLDSGADVNVNNQHTASATYSALGGCIALFTGVPAGSHTVKGRWRVLGGTAAAPGGQQVLLVIERKR